jgi:hypothetical protein
VTDRILADLVAGAHFGFVLFVVLGGLLVVRWPRVAFVHVPAAVWGIIIEFAGWVCPLTPIENELRRRGGEAGFSGGFVEHYVLPLMYPGNLTREVQFVLGFLVLAFNVAVYVWAAKRRARPR